MGLSDHQVALIVGRLRLQKLGHLVVSHADEPGQIDVHCTRCWESRRYSAQLGLEAVSALVSEFKTQHQHPPPDQVEPEYDFD